MSQSDSYRYFLSYSGVKLPLNLVSPVTLEGLDNRNTYFRARYDAQDRMIACEKIVYGEIELSHNYRYRADGSLQGASIEMDGEITELAFDENNQPIPA